MKKVSIILPTYNGEQFLRDSIESVLKQSYTNWELIIINDCSTDNTLNIANEYAKMDNRIKVISNEHNSKLPASLNVGFRNATGEYYTWTSDDNMYKPKAIQKMVEYLDENPNCDLVSFNFDFITEDCLFENQFTDLVPNRDMLQLIRQCNVGACFMYRKEIAVKTGEYDENMFCAEDYDYWCRIALNGNIHYKNENLYKYRNNSQSLTATKQKTIQEKTMDIRFKYAEPIMTKLGLSNTEKIKKLLTFYYNEGKKDKWIELAFNIDSKLTKKYKNKHFIKHFTESLLSVKNNNNDKIISLLGLKLKLKRNQTINKNTLELAKKWIKHNTVNNNGIIVSTQDKKLIYPEVTGYYIPTLIKYKDFERAKNYGDYLLTIQNENGSWNEPLGKIPYTFDTGMILKGLAALVENGLDENDKYKNALIRGADYILSMQRENGSIATQDYSWWGLPYEKRVPEAIHIYCLEPIRYVGKITNNDKYEICIKKALNYYLSLEDLTDFKTLSHFNAYIIEGLIDIGETERAKRAIDLIALHQRLDGSVSAYSNVDFVCSTGLFQYAICWYKLDERNKADKAFNYACSLQNKSGGWYGSYTVARDKANYFPEYEISWAVKYYLDALYYKRNIYQQEVIK